MKPATQWLLFAALGIAGGIALSIAALYSSPVTPPLGGVVVEDGGAAVQPEPSAPPAAETTSPPGEPPGDAGAEETRKVSLVPADALRDAEASMQVVLLPLAKVGPPKLDAVRAAARTRYPGLRVQPATQAISSLPVLLVGDMAAPAIAADELALFGRDLDAAALRALQRPRKAAVLELHVGGEDALAGLQRFEVLVADLADRAKAVVYDVETREYFAAKAWRERRVASWSGGLPEVPAEISIHRLPYGSGARSVTFGMAKFALPDLVVPAHPADDQLSQAIGTLINLAAQTLLERGQLDGPGTLRLRIDDLQEPDVRASMKKLMRGNARGEVEAVVVAGTPQEGDPENRLLELSFGDGPIQRQVDAAVRSLFGP